jgi:hypothetical protein
MAGADRPPAAYLSANSRRNCRPAAKLPPRGGAASERASTDDSLVPRARLGASQWPAWPGEQPGRVPLSPRRRASESAPGAAWPNSPGAGKQHLDQGRVSSVPGPASVGAGR